MALDYIESATRHITHNFLSACLSPVEQVLGFYMHKNHNNLHKTEESYIYEEENVASHEIPGTCLRIVDNSILKRSYSSRGRQRHVFYIRTPGEGKATIGVKLVYNGRILYVPEVLVHEHSLRLSVDYVQLMMILYRHMLGCRIGLHYDQKQSIEFVSSIPMENYVPVTYNYIQLLMEICRGRHSDEACIINPKHDGVSCWVYMSPISPPSLIMHVRNRVGFTYEYCGRLETLKNVRVDRQLAMLVEMVKDRDTNNLIAIDMFSDEVTCYSDRYASLARIASEVQLFDCNRGPLSSYSFKVTKGSTIGSAVSICDIMASQQSSTDGYVVYIGSGRPFKIKLSRMVTLDLEYRYITKDKVIYHQWNNGIAQCSPLEKYPYLEEGATYVFEVRVSDGAIVRIREDRTRGNSQHVTDSVLRVYKKDSKYSSEGVWTGRDLRFTLLINRMFKYYAYLRHIPKEAALIDMGSGNGGDVHIWKQMGYTVLSLEKDRDKCTIIRDKVKSNPKVLIKHRDMREVEQVVRGTPVRYTHVTFMRSIGHLSKDDIVSLLRFFKLYGTQRIVVVTSVLDMSKSCSIVDLCGQLFTTKVSLEGDILLNYYIGSKIESYTDKCYSLEQWADMCRLAECSLSVEYEWHVMHLIYGLRITDVTYPCTTDVALIIHL